MGWRNLSDGEMEISTEGCGRPKSLRARIDDKYISQHQNLRQAWKAGRRKALERISFKRSKRAALTWERILRIKRGLWKLCLPNPSRLLQPQTLASRRCYLRPSLDATERSAWKRQCWPRMLFPAEPYSPGPVSREATACPLALGPTGWFLCTAREKQINTAPHNLAQRKGERGISVCAKLFRTEVLACHKCFCNKHPKQTRRYLIFCTKKPPPAVPRRKMR